MYILLNSLFLFLMILLTNYTKHSFHIQNITRLWRKNIYLFSKKSDNQSKENNNKLKPLHNIVNNKKDKYFMNQENETYIIQNEFLKGKRLISISPGGFKGFYLFGTLSYIKENYDLSDFIYSGASAGAWNALFMCLKEEDSYFKTLIDDEELKKTISIQEFEKKMKTKLLLHFKHRENEFDFRRLFIGVTTVDNDYKLSTTIYNDFENLEDAINCCIASSHIPFITGGMINKYNGRLTFDGGFKSNPYLNINQSVLHVSPSMWTKIKESMSNDKGIAIKSNPSFLRNFKNFIEQTTLFKKDTVDFFKLYEEGYKEAKENKAILDDIMIYKNYSTNYYYT